MAAFIGQRAAAERILRQLQEHPDTWTQVVTILQNSQNLNTKFYALQVRDSCCFSFFEGRENFLMVVIYSYQVLEGVIKYRWNALPLEQCQGIKNYISDLIIQVIHFSSMI